MEEAGNQGMFIVIEGAEASGKDTQYKILKERLKAVGYDVASFDFPQYDNGSSYFVKKYLNGEFGPTAKINPYVASMFYALDHYDVATDINKALQKGKIVVANRYTGSNMAHQGANIQDDIERRSFFVWADNLEFQLLGIPRPNINIYLRVPAEVSKELASNKKIKSKGGQANDINHLRKAVATYDQLCQLFPKDFKAVECTKKGKLLNVPEINNLIWEQIKPLLPAKKQHASHSVVVTLSETEAKTENQATNEVSSVLTHEFKDASLFLQLSLQRLIPYGMPHSFDGWRPGNYRFYTPSRLNKQARGALRDGAEKLSIIHQRLIEKMSLYLDKPSSPKISVIQLLQPITPLGALSSFTLNINNNDIRRVATTLLANDSDELQWAAKQLYLAARQKWPHDFEQPLESSDSQAVLNKLVSGISGGGIASSISMDESIKMLEARPRLEFDLLAESIYPYTSLSLDEISEEVSSWPYSQKYQSLKEAAMQSETLRKVNYKFDILSDQITLDKIVIAAQTNNFQVQAPTPRYGYEMPKLIDDAAADDLYDATFDESLKMYSQLQAVDREDTAVYTTLLGHKVRWQLNSTAQDFRFVLQNKELAKSPVVKTITEKLTMAHPLLWDVITQGQVQAAAPEKRGKERVKTASRRRSKPKKS